MLRKIVRGAREVGRDWIRKGLKLHFKKPDFILQGVGWVGWGALRIIGKVFQKGENILVIPLHLHGS